MDVWIVAVAAGASCVAQRLKNLRKGKHNLPDLSCENSDFGVEMFRDREEGFQDASATEMTSTSSSAFSNSNFLVTFSKEEDNEGDCGSLPQESPGEMGFSYDFRRDRSNFRSRRINRHLIKPHTSLESCLMAQLYKEYGKFEDIMYSDRSPRRQTLRPFLVTDGSKVISRMPKLLKDTSLQDARMTVFGVPELPNLLSLDFQNEDKAKTGNQRVLRKGVLKMVDPDNSNAKGSYDEAFIFYLGLTMGALFSFAANKEEIEKLNKSLKQSENLVQDLHEELEMKDSLTVKELAADDSEPRYLQNAPSFDDAPREQKLENSYIEESGDQKKSGEDCMRKIEEELEAELERLESNMKSSSLEGKLSSIAEINPDFVSDVTMGELRADLFGANKGTQPYGVDREHKSGSSTHHSSQYPVSPRELSLRLHEVIQSRLEYRIQELETALQKSQQKVNEYEQVGPGELSRSSDKPVVINLSGDALAAYNEVYEEFTKLSDSEEEDMRIGNGGEVFGQCKVIGEKFGVNDDYMEGCLISNGSREETTSSCDEFEDEMERLLIKQIVEKAKQGSPALLKAQRSFLLSGYENEN